MTRGMLASSLVAQVALAAIFALYHPVLAGPPLICWPFDIGDAKSLPFEGPHWGSIKADYPKEALIRDTLVLLSPTMPVIVRMETIRRATVYASKDPKIAAQLLEHLGARATSAEGKAAPNALAVFDLGYLTECYKQAQWILKDTQLISGKDGYPLIQKAIHLRGNDPEMEFAAALVLTGAKDRKSINAHLQNALAGATEGSLLGKNLVRQAHLVGLKGTSLAELRSQVGIAKK